MKKRFILLHILYLVVNFNFSQTIFGDKIESIFFKKYNNNISSNILIGTLNERFSISFDVLSGIEHDVYYEIEHCDFDWNKSNLSKTEYLQGFDNLKIENIQSSFNTYQIYTNYQLELPNQNIKFKKSGNYIIRFLNEYGDKLFERKFIIYENLASVKSQIKRTRNLSLIDKKQVVQFQVNPINFQINNPDKNLKFKIFKNNESALDFKNLKPLYKMGSKLIYDYDEELSFWGGNEFLYFDNKSIRNTDVEIMGYSLDELYSTYLYSDIVRANKKYTYNPDINGGFLINITGSNEPNIEADYSLVYFKLNAFNIEKTSKIYIMGEFNNYQINERFKLEYNNTKNTFDLKIKLKQGFYNYKYVLTDSNNKIVEGMIRGNFDETENKYSIIVYYRNFGERYDRVIGYGTASSENISN